MEFISTDEFFILQPLQKGETNLWISRVTGEVSVRPSWDLASQDNPECHGITQGLLGKLRPHKDLCQRIILVRNAKSLGEIPGRGFDMHEIFKLQNVAMIPISTDSVALDGIDLKPCPKHHASYDGSTTSVPVERPPSDSSTPSSSGPSSAAATSSGRMSFPPLPLRATADAVKASAGSAAAALASQVRKAGKSASTFQATATAPTVLTSGPGVTREMERFERRMLEEFARMFNDSDSLYFSLTGDLTNSLQRQTEGLERGETVTDEIPLWKRADDRFFFNKHLLKEVIELGDDGADPFILPLVQGFVELRKAQLRFDKDQEQATEGAQTNGLPEYYTVVLISRRCRHRAGTRYNRRGVDENGWVANAVETEQVLLYHHYALSFVITRGSVPVFWSQPGFKYRPPPRLDRTETEDKDAFRRHIRREMEIYGKPLNCVSLVERSGRESVLSDAFMKNARRFDNESLGFATFDFHEACRGMKFENVGLLIEALQQQIKSMRYCWMDTHGVVCRQEGVFRVNCVDCLDRTNVVQTAIARVVLECQLTKLGLSPAPDAELPREARLGFQDLWANNGDLISRQYAGTNALKGDFTRTGERNISGLMKDGVNSASRYYLNHVRDAFRQAAIDLVTGQPLSEEILRVVTGATDESEIAAKASVEEQAKEEDLEATAERVRSLIEDCKKLLIPDLSTVIGAWGLIDSDPVTGDPRETDLDVVFIVTRDAYYVAKYEDETEKVTQFQKVLLQNVERVELGPVDQLFSLPNFAARNNVGNSVEAVNLRLSYRMPGEAPAAKDAGYYHQFRPVDFRFFNNAAVAASTREERMESLRAVADALLMAAEADAASREDKTVMWAEDGQASEPEKAPPLMLREGKLERRKSKVVEQHPSRSGNEGSVRSAGSRALSSMSSQFSKLNPISKLKLTVSRKGGASPVNVPASEDNNSDAESAGKAPANVAKEEDKFGSASFHKETAGDGDTCGEEGAAVTLEPGETAKRETMATKLGSLFSPILQSPASQTSPSLPDKSGQKDGSEGGDATNDAANESSEAPTEENTTEVKPESISTLEKLTKGFQNFGASFGSGGGKGSNAEDAKSGDAEEEEIVNIMDIRSHTRILIL